MLNPSAGAVAVPLGAFNAFDPGPINRSQPTLFAAGWTAFATTFTAAQGEVRWTLGDDTASAGTASPTCASVIGNVVMAGLPAVGNTVTMAGDRVHVLAGSYDVDYRWYRGCDSAEPVQIANARSVQVFPDDVGHRLQGVVTYRRMVAGDPEKVVGVRISTPCDEASTAGAPPASGTAPAVDGTPRVGRALSLSGGSWTGSAVESTAVRWEACGGASCEQVGTGDTFTPTAGEQGRSIRAVVTASNRFGSGSVTTAAVGPVRPEVAGPGRLLPAVLTFPEAVVGERTTRTVYYTNSNPDPVGVGGITLGGADSASFAILGDDCAAVVAPGESCAIDVSFQPPVAGQASAQLRIDDGATATATLVGTARAAPGIPPAPAPAVLTLGAARVDLGKVPVGKQGRSRTVRLTNTGGSPLLVQSVAVAGRHRKDVVLATTCPGDTLAAGASCAVTLRLKPAAPGRRKATLVVTTTAGVQTVVLTGQGVRKKR